MDLRVLNYFLMVAREENITKAAQLLHITQPTLSRQLVQLEEELGVKLFDRSNHKMLLTGDGLLLRRRAQEMVLLADKTRQELNHDEAELSGEISIGCGELRSMNDMAEIMSAFCAQQPKVRFDIVSGNATDIKQQIELGTLDMGLLLEPIAIDAYDFVRLAAKERWGALVREDSALASRKAIRPEDLVGQPLLVAGSNPIQNELSNWFGPLAAQMETVATYNLLYNATEFAVHHAAVILCLDLNCSYPGLKFMPLTPQLTLSSVLAWKATQAQSPLMAAFIRFAKETLLRSDHGEKTED